MRPKDLDAPGARNDCGKIAYTSRSKAKAAEKANRLQGRDHMGVYLCAVCELFHIGHSFRIGKPVNRVSKKRAKANRERKAMLARVFGPNPLCARCGRPADDAHELLSRARGGSITDPANVVALCRGCHEWVTVNPALAEAQGWALSAFGGAA